MRDRRRLFIKQTGVLTNFSCYSHTRSAVGPAGLIKSVYTLLAAPQGVTLSSNVAMVGYDQRKKQRGQRLRPLNI